METCSTSSGRGEERTTLASAQTQHAGGTKCLSPTWFSRDASGMRMVTERSTTALMVEALRDLRSEKDTQLQARDEKIQRLEKDNAELRERLERLEKRIERHAP